MSSIVIRPRAKVTSRSRVAEAKPNLDTLSQIKRNSSTPFIPSSEVHKSSPNFSIFQ
jgi:hypothetical protein